MNEAGEVIPKEGGARSVISWGVNVERRYNPYYNLRGSVVLHAPEDVAVRISVVFDDEEAAVEFQAMVLAMMPEVRR